MLNEESKRKELARKINAAMKNQDLETLQEVYAMLRRS